MADDSLIYCNEAPIKEFLDRLSELLVREGLDVVSLSREVARAIDFAEARGRITGIRLAEAHVKDVEASGFQFGDALYALDQLAEVQEKVVAQFFGTLPID